MFLYAKAIVHIFTQISSSSDQRSQLNRISVKTLTLSNHRKLKKEEEELSSSSLSSMDTQALLFSTEPTTPASTDLTFKLPVSHSTPLLFPEIHPYPLENGVPDPKDSIFRSNSSLRRSGLHRSKTAPALVTIKGLKAMEDEAPKPEAQSGSIIRQGMVLLVLYLVLGIVIYSFNREKFSGVETNPVVDALYFCIVTMCTIGYGDIAPLTPSTKIFACFFVLIGFGFIDVLLSGVVNYVLDLQENMILTGIQVNKAKTRDGFSARDYIIDVEKGRMRIRLKVGLALLVVLLCIGTGAIVLYVFEDLDWVDSVYLSVMSVTTVGYGDRAFTTLSGRLFAAVWLLISTLAVARAFLYLAEARVNKRHRRIAHYVLHRDITVEDLLAADINQHGFISKSEYVIYKLKEMGKVGEKELMQICNQFSKLDSHNSGKITLPDLFKSRM